MNGSDDKDLEGRAGRYISDLQKKLARMRRSSGLMDILPTVVSQANIGKCPSGYLKHLLKRIRRNQWNAISLEEKGLVDRLEASLEAKQNK